MMDLNSDIHYIFRKKERQFHSIESVFSILIPLVKKNLRIHIHELPSPGARPEDIRRNLRSWTKKKNTMLAHITGHVNYMAIRTGSYSVLTVHDIRSALHGHMFTRVLKLILWFWIPVFIVRKVTVISNHSKSELCRYVPWAANKISVIPNPLHPDFTFLPKKALESPVSLLFIGTKPNKNLERFLEAVRGLPVYLHIVGILSKEQRSLAETNVTGMQNYVDLPLEQLIRCYREADLLCFPSLYEGFGMPIIEAQASGTPVITSDRGAMKEVAGEGAQLIDPESVESIREGLINVIENQSYRESLIQKGLENVKRFKAEFIAEQYTALYREVIEGIPIKKGLKKRHAG